jgi:hypothetical protein
MFSETTKARQVGSVWVERLYPTGAYRLTWLGNGPGYSAVYMGYSQRDALAIFRRERREGAR